MKILLIIITSFIFCQSCYQLTDTKQIKTELYFGLSNNEGPISDSSWVAFKKETLEIILNGYTEIDSNGFWKDSDNNSVRERSKIIIYIHEKSIEENNKIDSLIDLYKVRFQQQSVLKTDYEINTSF